MPAHPECHGKLAAGRKRGAAPSWELMSSELLDAFVGWTRRTLQELQGLWPQNLSSNIP